MNLTNFFFKAIFMFLTINPIKMERMRDFFLMK